MDTKNVKIPMGLAVILSEVINSILNVVDEKGNVTPRKLPFRLTYRLTRNKTGLDRDLKVFNEKKMYLLAKYGDITPDGTNVELKDPKKLEMYSKEINALIETEVEHNIIPLEMEDIDKVTENIPMSNEALKLFIGYLTADDALYADLEKEISFKKPNLNTEEDKVEETPTTTTEPIPVKKSRKKAPPKVSEEKKEEVVKEETSVPVKKPRKKPVTKTEETSKVEEEKKVVKKTTTKKTTSKKKE